jgi:hypothetical protein
MLFRLYFGDNRYLTGGRGCNGTYDNIMCFEATPANVTLGKYILFKEF